ncbi:MAG TPA: hypothetical protein VFO10_25260 [Oligoflexus sp.]|uniref:hypothetical protein n=1 Tax=Oligoflexus sp. TaxID=1971216 RepID=UPI002D80452E|nr:hypothetical protein [Oligoflexus sp.]HET9240598.1 hypothetical protein [Oligoflexus sp.]
MNADDYLTKATNGKLSPKEMKDLVNAIRSEEGDTYTLLLALGRAWGVQNKDLVEKYLVCPENPMLSRLAIQILCKYWDLGQNFLAHIQEAANGFEWDDEDDVRLMAISCLGYIYTQNKQTELLRQLYDIWNDEAQDKMARESSYLAMGLAIGYGYDQLPPASRHFDVRKDIDPEVIRKVEGLIKK